MSIALKRILWLFACLLVSIFCCIFVINNRILLVVLLTISLVVAIISWVKLGKKSFALQTHHNLQDIFKLLPSAGYRQPIILTYQYNEENIFSIDSHIRQTDHGCYIFIKHLNEIDNFVEALLIERPSWRNQISTLMIIYPEQQNDTAVLMGQLHEYFYQISRINNLTKSYTNSLIATCLDGDSSPWFEIALPNHKLTVWTNGQTPVAYKDWIKNSQDLNEGKRLSQVLQVNSWLKWFNNNVITEYTNNDPDHTYVHPISMGVMFTSLPVKKDNLWEMWVKQQIGLPKIDYSRDEEKSIFLPDFMIRLLPHQTGYHPITKAFTYATGLICVFLGTAFIGSYINNKNLLRSISHDINHFYQIPNDKEVLKKNSFVQLQKDADILDQYYRDGVPLYLDEGLYSGEKITPPLLQAINSYNPRKFVQPQIRPKDEEPMTISGALFDSGKSTFKPGSTKILIQTLLQIKAKQGWLILITGHTDSTGNEGLNKKLSKERAEAVQNWMIQNSDIPSTCFAVQGYGSTQPVADNSTDDGRAANRRVEVRLIPDKSSTCRIISKELSDHITPPKQGG